MAKILIIGYGNPLRGDDALGWEVAQRLMDEADSLGEVEVVAPHQLTPELAETASEVACVIFVDASCQGPAGQIEVREVVPAQKPPTSFSHHFTPDVLLACTSTLYGTCPQAYLVAVAGESFDYGEPMSGIVQELLPTVVERIHELIKTVQAKAKAEKTDNA